MDLIRAARWALLLPLVAAGGYLVGRVVGSPLRADVHAGWRVMYAVTMATLAYLILRILPRRTR